MMTGPGYGQPMMHGMIPPQGVMQQPQQPQQPPPQQQQQQQPPQVAQPHPAQQQDDLGVKVKRSFANFDTNLKVMKLFTSPNSPPYSIQTFLHEYSSILQMDDARLK